MVLLEEIFLIFDLGDLGFTVETEKSQVGLIISISWFYLLKQREGRKKGLSFKKSRYENYHSLTSIMKVLLVGFCGLLWFWLVQVKFWSCFL